jgi:hypothetical protein
MSKFAGFRLQRPCSSYFDETAYRKQLFILKIVQEAVVNDSNGKLPGRVDTAVFYSICASL